MQLFRNGDQAGHVTRQTEPDTVEKPVTSTFEGLYRAERLKMVRLAAFLVNDLALAEDVVQDAFAALHARWNDLCGTPYIVPYLRRTVVNRSRSALRRRRTARRHLWPDLDSAPGADHDVLKADEHARLRQALTRLPRRQREVLVLRYWGNLSEAEIAHTLGVSTGTVKSSASRGLDALESAVDRP
jgi:RNA polymerase sigma-70 factor (sigma-E family)